MGIMNEADEQLLEKYGWIVECYSPFEIRTKDGSFASGEAAQYVLDGIRQEDADSNKKSITLNDRDELLLEIYQWGFNDELENRIRMWNPNSLLLKAYDIGRADAIVGDDVGNADYQTNEEILYKIKYHNV